MKNFAIVCVALFVASSGIARAQSTPEADLSEALQREADALENLPADEAGKFDNQVEDGVKRLGVPGATDVVTGATSTTESASAADAPASGKEKKSFRQRLVGALRKAGRVSGKAGVLVLKAGSIAVDVGVHAAVYPLYLGEGIAQGAISGKALGPEGEAGAEKAETDHGLAVTLTGAATEVPAAIGIVSVTGVMYVLGVGAAHAGNIYACDISGKKKGPGQYKDAQGKNVVWETGAKKGQLRGNGLYYHCVLLDKINDAMEDSGHKAGRVLGVPVGKVGRKVGGWFKGAYRKIRGKKTPDAVPAPGTNPVPAPAPNPVP